MKFEMEKQTQVSAYLNTLYASGEIKTINAVASIVEKFDVSEQEAQTYIQTWLMMFAEQMVRRELAEETRKGIR